MTAPEFFSADGSSVTPHDPEDKRWWIDRGTELEAEFLALCQRVGILDGIRENPERAKGGMSLVLPEFVYRGDHLDLKMQSQPFFMAGELFGVHPRYAVTLNWQDVADVSTKYPRCNFAIWVRWESTAYQRPNAEQRITVGALHGVWWIDPTQLRQLISAAHQQGRRHWYQRRRTDDSGNAKSSYVLDVRDLELLWIDPAVPLIFYADHFVSD